MSNLNDAVAAQARLDGRKLVASVSGGKDSAALSLWLTEVGLEHERVFLDTGWESEKTYAYLDELEEAIGPIIRLKAERTMAELCLHKGMFPSRVRRFCTQELKVKPMIAYIAKRVDEGEDLVNAVGIRHEESAARAKMPEWEWSDGFDCETWRPLIEWSEEDVIAIHTRHGLRPNPLYLEGASRVGCWPCIFARKAEIRHIADSDPERINFIRDLEKQVQAKAAARYAEKGETFESLGYTKPTWFQAPLRKRDANGKTIRTGECWPIDRVVGWSRTTRGGKQLELFEAGPSEAGCVRWGLCDTIGS